MSVRDGNSVKVGINLISSTPFTDPPPIPHTTLSLDQRQRRRYTGGTGYGTREGEETVHRRYTIRYMGDTNYGTLEVQGTVNGRYRVRYTEGTEYDTREVRAAVPAERWVYRKRRRERQ